MICRVGGGEHESGRAEAQRCYLRSNWLAMVGDVMGPEILDPAHRFGARGCCHYGEIGERADELDRDRADAASAADDENCRGRARHRLADIHAIEQGFPGGDRCERQRRRLGKSELVYPRLEPVDEVLAAIDSVSHDDIRAVAADILTRPKTLAVVGPFDDASAFQVS